MNNQRMGSTRIASAVEPGVIAFRYTDMWSVFDRGPSPQEIPGLGAARCACSVKSFKLAQRDGVPTHFVRQADEVTIHVREFGVPGKEPLSGKVHGQVLNAEWIWRLLAYGSLLERLRLGERLPEDFGFAPGTKVTEGMRLPVMVRECTTKFEAVDRHLSNEETRNLIRIDQEQWDTAWLLVKRAQDAIAASYDKARFMRPDGKMELGMTDEGGFAVVDVFGTQDEDRIIDLDTSELCCKDLLRNELKSLPWKAELDRAKKDHPNDKSKWPPYPRLPDEFMSMVLTRYAEVARRYAGVTI
jgi:phosphoribosylaminoimidazole-succinocarboxamide synthase